MSQIKLPHNTTLIDHRKPMQARVEETIVESGLTAADAQAPRRGLRWHLSPESYQRVLEKMACWQCLSTFPAVPCAMNVGLFDTYQHCRPKAVANRLIRAGCCPVCAAEISDVMLGHFDEGENPLNKRKEGE